ncbi:hypothetical protein [uncultured Roseobacter sp.]|uniref:hypothetical protein n=1 Tax=uncultured Roseobacter sp. TaxID=114847 RepID=UPI002623D53D|nr:hypothetical protein [uncultured Roseobacter sp.]
MKVILVNMKRFIFEGIVDEVTGIPIASVGNGNRNNGLGRASAQLPEREFLGAEFAQLSD